MMPTRCIVDAEKDVDMKSLSQKEAIAILSDMKIDIPVPKAAVTQRKRNEALDMAISALSCSEIPNSSNAISRQAAIDALDKRFYGVPKELTTEILQLRRDLRERIPSAEPEIKPIDYCDCANAMLKMWIDDVVTDGEYYRIMNKLNKHELERRNNGGI